MELDKALSISADEELILKSRRTIKDVKTLLHSNENILFATIGNTKVYNDISEIFPSIKVMGKTREIFIISADRIVIGHSLPFNRHYQEVEFKNILDLGVKVNSNQRCFYIATENGALSLDVDKDTAQYLIHIFNSLPTPNISKDKSKYKAVSVDIGYNKETYKFYIERTRKEEKIQLPKGERLNTLPDNYTVIDIETTGLKYTDDIIEFSAIKVVNNEIVKELSFLAKPKKDIPYNISDLTGITNDMVENKPYFDERINDVVEFIGDDIILGHNVIFDIDRINNYVYHITGKAIENDYVDTLNLAKCRIKDIDNHKLTTIAQYLGIKVDTAHRALDDCRTTIECYKKLISIAPLYDEYSVNSRLLHKNGYHYLNTCESICYNKDKEERSLKGMFFALIEKPYYASPGLFENILHKNKAKEIDCCFLEMEDLTEEFMFLNDIPVKKITHFIVRDTKYKSCMRHEYVKELIDKYNIEVITETKIYEMLGIEIPFDTTKKSQTTYLRQKDVQATCSEFDENHILFNKTIVITGALNTISRSEAYLKIKNVGGLCGDSVTKKTNYLVTNSTAPTGKMKKALEYQAQGQDIKIINEAEFLKLLR